MLKFTYILLFIIMTSFTLSCSNAREECYDICINYYASYYEETYKNRSEDAVSNTIKFMVDSSNVEVTKDANNYAVFTGDKLISIAENGGYNVPFKKVSVVLPPNIDKKTIKVTLINYRVNSLPGEWLLAKSNSCYTYFNKSMHYSSEVWMEDDSAMYPKKIINFRNIRTGKLRSYDILDIPVALYSYNTETKQLFKNIDIKIEITYGVIKNQNLTKAYSNIINDKIGLNRVKTIAINYEKYFNRYIKRHQSDKIIASEKKPGYAILTSMLIANTSTELNNFVKSKQDLGFQTFVFTENDWNGGSGDKAANNIRKWLQNNYIDLNLKYVLFIGNPNPQSLGVPMKMLYPRSNSECSTNLKDAPSDYFYAELSGNWDIDNDGLYGEWSCGNRSGDFGPGGVDNYYEVIVGRIPQYSGGIIELDSILRKSIEYSESTIDSIGWRRNVLLPMKYDSSNGIPRYVIGEKIKNDILVPYGYQFHRIYDYSYNLDPRPETTPLVEGVTSDIWSRKKFGLVVWSTHGLANTAEHIMSADEAKILNDGYPAFTFQISCNNSYPESNENLSFNLLKNGAVATIGATRVSWDNRLDNFQSSYNGSLAYSYVNKLLVDNLSTGEALHRTKEELMPDSGPAWMNLLVYNIYGDPQLGINSAK